MYLNARISPEAAADFFRQHRPRAKRSCRISVSLNGGYGKEGEEVTVFLEKTGRARIKGPNKTICENAGSFLENLGRPVQVGQVFFGLVGKRVDFGLFVIILSGFSGFMHVSEMAEPEEILRPGDLVWVKIIDIDRKNRIRLSGKNI